MASSAAPKSLPGSSESKDSKEQQKWMQALDKVVDAVIVKLKRREIRGSGTVAMQTAELLRTVVTKGKFENIQELMLLVKSIGKRLSESQPIELAIGNIVRRVLFIIRREVATYIDEEKKGRVGDKTQQQITVDLSLSLHKLLDEQEGAPYTELAKGVGLDALREALVEEISLLMDEIKTVYMNISEQAVEHIYAKEVILTYGVSRTVLEFLKEAAGFRKFEVIVAESAPSYEGQKMAVQLSELGIETTCITDSAVFAMMSSVNKVIIGTHGVMANGGLIAHTGVHNLVLCASHHSVPVVVLTGLHKLCPLYAFDQDTFNERNPPSEVLKFEDNIIDKVDVVNPAFDYIPPELITLFITNFGGHNPSYIYRLLANMYNPEDYEL